jgi:hypothetical protein
MAMSPEEIVATYPSLSLAAVQAALAYYHGQRAEVDADIEADKRFVATMKAQAGASKQSGGPSLRGPPSASGGPRRLGPPYKLPCCRYVDSTGRNRKRRFRIPSVAYASGSCLNCSI